MHFWSMQKFFPVALYFKNGFDHRYQEQRQAGYGFQHISIVQFCRNGNDQCQQIKNEDADPERKGRKENLNAEEMLNSKAEKD